MTITEALFKDLIPGWEELSGMGTQAEKDDHRMLFALEYEEPPRRAVTEASSSKEGKGEPSNCKKPEARNDLYLSRGCKNGMTGGTV